MKSSCSGTRAVKHWHAVGRTILSAVFAALVVLLAAYRVMAAEGDLLWVKSTAGPGSAGSRAVSALPDGTAFVTGTFGGAVTFGPGEPNETILGPSGNGFVAKYTPYGTLDWVKPITGGTGAGIAAQLDGGAVVTGRFDDTVTLGEGEPTETTLTSSYPHNTFLAKYNRDGTLAWARYIANADGVYSRIAALPAGGVLVTGEIFSHAKFEPGEPNETILDADHIGVFVARYNADGTFLWARQASGQMWAPLSFAIAALPGGSALVTGGFDETWTFGDGEPNETTLTVAPATDPATEPSTLDIFLARYNPDGTLAWARRDGGGNIEISRAITGLPDGGAVVTGYFGRYYGAETATFGQGEPNETTLTSNGKYDIFVVRYRPDGALAWAKGAGGAGTDYLDMGLGIAAFSDGSTMVAGVFEGAATFGQGEPNETILTSDGRLDAFVAKYNSDGTLAWVKRAGGADGDWAIGVSALADGGSVVTGGFGGTATFGPGEPNETTLTPESGSDLFLARFEGWRAPDLDGDGLPDAVETDTGTYNGPTDTGTDPHNPDTDGDGLIDGDELSDLDPDMPGVQNPFDPLDPDTTGDNFQDTPDGVPDGQNDYDGDGQSNAYELEHGSNPLDAASIVPALTYVGALALIALLLVLVFSRLPYVRRRRLGA